MTADQNAHRLRVDLDGERHELFWPSRETLVDVLVSRGIAAPSSCREGVCGACAVRLVGGSVRMLANRILDDEDLADGWILGCQAVPEGDEQICVSYD